MWATASDVLSITGKSVSHEQITRAQYVIQAFTGLTDTDAFSDREAYWLKLATAYQTAYDEDTNRPAAGVSSLAQGDLSVSFDESNKDLAPKAYTALRRMRGSVRSVPVGTLYNHIYETDGWEAI